MVYNMIYRDGDDGKAYAKRFAVTSITRDKPYDLTKGTKGSRVMYLTANPNSESEVVAVSLNPRCKARLKNFEFDFETLAIKGRNSQGNIITKWPVRKVSQKEAGQSSLGGLHIWYDETVGRLNTETRGAFLGSFENEDKILIIYKHGSLELTNFELTNRYENEKIELIIKYNPDILITVVHYDADDNHFYVKRFKVESDTIGRVISFIGENKGSFPAIISVAENPKAEIKYLFGKQKERRSEIVDLNLIVEVKGWKARGNRVSSYQVIDVKPIKEDGPEIIIAGEEQANLFD